VTENQGHIPSSIVAGESLWIASANTAQNREDITFSDYTPAGGYTLSYQFAAATPITVAAAANGDNTGWTLEVSPAQTLTWRAGPLRFAAYVTHTATGRTFAVDAGQIMVSASPLATSHWTAIVAACDAAILSGSASGIVSFGVDGMSTAYRNPTELMALRDYARTMELHDTGNRPARIIRARFT